MTDLLSLGADVEPPPGQGSTGQPLAAGGSATGRLGELARWFADSRGSATPELHRARIVVVGSRSCPVETVELAGASLYQVTDLASRSDAVDLGVGVADAEVDGGTDLLAIAVPDVDVAAMTLVSVLTNTEPVKVMPRGAVLSPQTWMAQTIAVRDGRRAAMAVGDDPEALLATLDSAALQLAVGLILRAAGRRTPVLLDGLGAVAAATLAHTVQPRLARWLRVCDRAEHPAVDIALARLEQRPLLDLGIGTADGTAAVLAVLLLRVARE